MDTRSNDEVAAVVRFIDCINRGDTDGLGALMTDGHTLQVFDESPLVGREANVEAWRGYNTAFPNYAIHVHKISETADGVAVRGHTTGSHLGLSDEEERTLTVIWLARLAGGRLILWRLCEDTPALRRDLGLDAD